MEAAFTDDEIDPIVRELRALRSIVRWMIRVSALLFVMLAVAVALALYLRSSDLQMLTKRAAEAEVASCFSRVGTATLWENVAADPTVSPTLNNLALAQYLIAPTVRDCRTLADRLHVAVPAQYETG